MDTPTWGDTMEIGKYIDFHYKDSTADYDGRLFFENRKLHLELPNIGNTEIVTKSDLFANNYQTNPDLVATPFAAINGFNSAVTNIPDDAKNTWNSLQTIWLFPNEIGDLTKNRLQIIITGNNTSHRRMYENGKFSDWS